MFCQKCGNQLENEVKFCMKCGTSTDAKAPATENAAPTPQNSSNSNQPNAMNQGVTMKTLIMIIVGLLMVGAIAWLAVDNYKQSHKTPTEQEKFCIECGTKVVPENKEIINVEKITTTFNQAKTKLSRKHLVIIGAAVIIVIVIFFFLQHDKVSFKTLAEEKYPDFSHSEQYYLDQFNDDAYIGVVKVDGKVYIMCESQHEEKVEIQTIKQEKEDKYIKLSVYVKRVASKGNSDNPDAYQLVVTNLKKVPDELEVKTVNN